MNSVIGRTRWNTVLHGGMTEAAIRLIHGAPTKARVSKYVYEKSSKIEGTAKNCVGYVMSGHIEFASGGESVELGIGEILEFAGGDYVLKTKGGSGAVVVWVWDLMRLS